MKKKIILYVSLLSSVWVFGVCAATSQQFMGNTEIFKQRGIAVSVMPSQAEYAAIWQKHKDGAIWQARHGMGGAQYQQTAKQLKHEGFRVVHVSGQGVDNMVRFVAIWTEKGDIDWHARHDLTLEEYQSIDQELAVEGYHLTSLNDYQVYGENRYAAVWQKEENKLVVEPPQHHLITSEYQKAFDELMKKGYKLVHISELGQQADDRYGAIWWERQPVGLTDFKGAINHSFQTEIDNSVLRNAHNTSIYLR